MRAPTTTCLWLSPLLTAAFWLIAIRTHAVPGDAPMSQGLSGAKPRDCRTAIPLLEEAERVRHRPSNAMVLADCYDAVGELLRARAVLHALLTERSQPFWMRSDHNAAKTAQRKAADVDRRIPTLRVQAANAYENLEVVIDGRPLTNATETRQVKPDVIVTLVARARGHQELTARISLHEGERHTFPLRLDPLPPAPPQVSPRPTRWLGARYYGAVLPTFVMNLVADGGRTLLVPGAALTFTTQATSHGELTIALGYLSYGMADTPFKPHGQPDTEWERIGSSLQALSATVEFVGSFPLDPAGRVRLRAGGAAGLGWMFLGDLTRVQVYPADGKPGDPWTYATCKGPNNPLGTFRYCNALDKDATHYPGYAEPSWFARGLRPLLFPWLVVPQLGLSLHLAHRLIVDLDLGVSLSGFLTSAGLRVGL